MLNIFSKILGLATATSPTMFYKHLPIVKSTDHSHAGWSAYTIN